MNTKILLAAVVLPLFGAAQAQTKWDMPTPYSDGEFHTRNAKAFAEDVKKNTNGALDITVGEYFTPNGRNLGGGGVKQGAGITPQVKIAKGVDTPHGLDLALTRLASEVR